MSGSRQQALVDARKLVRTFASAPDARRRAQAVMSELRHADGWNATAQRDIDAVDAWLRTSPSVSALEPRLRELLDRLAKA
jgi:hypothetical protein